MNRFETHSEKYIVSITRPDYSGGYESLEERRRIVFGPATKAACEQRANDLNYGKGMFDTHYHVSKVAVREVIEFE